MTNAYESEGPLPAACARLERDLAGFLDGTLDAGGSERVADHLADCARCAALLDSLGGPSEVGRAVAALPAMRAPEHLWAGVAARIAAPVVEIGSVQRPAAGVQRVAHRGWLRSGLAAAGLVVMTAGVTYTLTVRQRETPATVATTQPPAATPTPAPTSAQTPTQVAATIGSAPDSSLTPPSSATRGTGSNASSVTSVANRSRSTGVRRALTLPSDPTRDTYDHEIAKLRIVLAQRQSGLDTSTVRVLTESMRVIDRAIAQSKAALARDPASGFLNKQLNNALDQKLELLRTAALLPART